MSKKVKVCFAVPVYKAMRYIPFWQSVQNTLTRFDELGYEAKFLNITGCPYIGQSRNYMMAEFLQDTDCDVFFSLDYDLSWNPDDIVKIVNLKHDIVSVNYRYRREPEQYMAIPCLDEAGKPITCSDGTIWSEQVPAGFTAIKRGAVERMYREYRYRMYTDTSINPAWKPREVCDLWITGLFEGRYWGEDFGFCRLWTKLGKKIHILPDVDISHWDLETDPVTFKEQLKEYKGNYFKFLNNQPK